MRLRPLFVFGGSAILSLCASAQLYPQTPTSSNNTTAGSTAGATAVIDQSGSTVPRSFIGATPGVITPGVFPGIPIPNSEWQLYRPAIMRSVTMDEINRMKRKFHVGDIIPLNWKIRVRGDVIGDPKNILPNENPIHLVNWWPGAISYESDRAIGRVTVICDYLDPEELCLGLGLAEAKKLTHTSRVAIRVRERREGVTKGLSVGVGGAAGRITQPGTDNDAVAAATGGLIGTNRVRVEDYLEFEIFCLNDGPIEPPTPPEQPRQIQQTQVQPPPPAPPVQVVRVEIAPIKVDLSDLKVMLSSLLPVPIQPVAPTPAPQQPLQDSCDASGLPDLTVFFDFDKSKVKDEYLDPMRFFVLWLESHPKCHVQIEGHTCRSGTYDYDAALGRRRAKAVYDQMIANGGKPEQIEQFVSVSKDRLASEYEAPNRRAIVRIIGKASGK